MNDTIADYEICNLTCEGMRSRQALRRAHWLSWGGYVEYVGTLGHVRIYNGGAGGSTPCEAPEVASLVAYCGLGRETTRPWWTPSQGWTALEGRLKILGQALEACNPDNTLPRHLGRFNPRANAKSVLHFNLYSCHWHTSYPYTKMCGIDSYWNKDSFNACPPAKLNGPVNPQINSSYPATWGIWWGKPNPMPEPPAKD